MGKKTRFSTFSLGSEPDQPDIKELAEFIARSRGIVADLITFQLERSLIAQKESGVTTPCGGGIFYQDRLNSIFTQDGSDLFVEPEMTIHDASVMIRCIRSAKAAVPSPAYLENSPSPDDEELLEEYCSGYKMIFREMRDTGISGHIIHTRTPGEIELEYLTSRKNLFYLHEKTVGSFEVLLEYQQDLVISGPEIPLVMELSDRYDIRRIIILEPDSGILVDLSEEFDPGDILVAGYGSGDESVYWKKISEKSEVTL